MMTCGTEYCCQLLHSNPPLLPSKSWAVCSGTFFRKVFGVKTLVESPEGLSKENGRSRENEK